MLFIEAVRAVAASAASRHLMGVVADGGEVVAIGAPDTVVAHIEVHGEGAAPAFAAGANE